MKEKLLNILCIVVLVGLLTGCGTNNEVEDLKKELEEIKQTVDNLEIDDSTTTSTTTSSTTSTTKQKTKTTTTTASTTVSTTIKPTITTRETSTKRIPMVWDVENNHIYGYRYCNQDETECTCYENDGTQREC